ncbi:MAG: glutamine--fructose-6-phosphate transaminase (isomerizing) [Candidatus Falkowbacteria bacterium]|nr:glutamine--fructose-6-phosphate transaminase (isomerizing) [Candidatus Falkowbacteria bacterium]
MCGIVGYIGEKQAWPIILKGLERLEYRGYDSAGVALHNNENILVYKKSGKVENLKKLVDEENRTNHNLGIGHTRWATHGAPSDVNSHPHASQSGNIVLVHNGIIENYAALKQALEARGYVFKSETDTEVISNLIESIKKENISTVEAVRLALTQVTGAYGLAIISQDEPDQLIVARKGSPIVIGIGEKEFFVASDAAPIIEHTKQVIYLDDGDVAILQRNGVYTVTSMANEIKHPEVKSLELDITAIEKGDFDHFMLKEIFEQPRAITDSIRGRINLAAADVILGGISQYEEKFLKAKRIILVACGTSWHAALTGEYFVEELARIPAEVEYASEFRYRNPVINENDIVIAISQSGETADTLAAIEIAKEKGATVLGICNVIGSSIARQADAGIYTHAGQEIGVASTKAFTTQLSVLLLLAVRLGKLNKQLDDKRSNDLLKSLMSVPDLMEKVLAEKSNIFELAKTFITAKDVFYLGRGFAFPTALEGALKLKEISYIHAEAYPAAEMKHGPIALIDEGMPVIFIATEGKSFDKVISNMEEMKARGARIIAIASEGTKSLLESVSETIIEIPKIDEILVPFLAAIPLQLLSYQVAVLRGCDVDKPRNLAKSVTVE